MLARHFSSFSLAALTLMLGCGDDRAPESAPSSSSEPSVSAHDDASGPFLGFAPTVGVTETPITLQFSLADACHDASCTVTLDGLEAAFADETRTAVLVPRSAKSGDICVSSDLGTSCRAGFTVLERPLVDEVLVDVGPSGAVLDVRGAGFPRDAVIVIGFERLVTTFGSPHALSGVVPTSLAGGTYDVVVLSPSHGRCGTPSAAVAVDIE
jgi:hypothetical protein